jgi:hypothetical protein
MRFSWKAVLLAPLAVPLIYAAALSYSNRANNPLLGFALFIIAGCLVSYSSTIFLLLPSIFIISRVKSLTAPVMALTGAALGAFAWLPVSWVDYTSSGPDSGPPIIPYVQYFAQTASDFVFFVVAGLLTSVLYWFLSSRREPK